MRGYCRLIVKPASASRYVPKRRYGLFATGPFPQTQACRCSLLAGAKSEADVKHLALLGEVRKRVTFTLIQSFLTLGPDRAWQRTTVGCNENAYRAIRANGERNVGAPSCSSSSIPIARACTR